MIGLGATLVSQFSRVLYIFALFLIFTGVKMWMTADEEYDVGASPILRWVKSRFQSPTNYMPTGSGSGRPIRKLAGPPGS